MQHWTGMGYQSACPPTKDFNICGTSYSVTKNWVGPLSKGQHKLTYLELR